MAVPHHHLNEIMIEGLTVTAASSPVESALGDSPASGSSRVGGHSANTKSRGANPESAVPHSGSPFKLPAARAAKADPALTAADELHFAAMAASLEQTRMQLSDRLDAARKEPARMGQEAVERDIEVRRLASRLRALQRFGLDACLGRIEPADGSGPLYIGRFGLTGTAGGSLLTDWRAPAAEPFFGASHANPMGLAGRRRYRWSQGFITDYWDERFTLGGGP